MQVKWPINVILTEASQACYGQVFSFMLQLKRVAWTLTDCWYRLKRDGESGLSGSFPFDPKLLHLKQNEARSACVASAMKGVR